MKTAGVVGGCGHGPKRLCQRKPKSGSYLVKDKRVAGFPNSTERSKSWAGQGSLLPFCRGSTCKNGAMVQNKETLADKHAVVVDQRIVSTMFFAISRVGGRGNGAIARARRFMIPARVRGA